MSKHGGTPSPRDKRVTPAAISPPGVARGRFVGGQQSGLARCKPPPLFTRRASSCSSQGQRQGEPWGASPRPGAPTYLPVMLQIPDVTKPFMICTNLHKFRSWIHSTVLGRSLVDHQALISWFCEDLGTISGSVGQRGRWHEFSSQFNIQVEYTPRKEHIVPDTLIQWAYPACEHAGDATMHGSVPDREAVHRDESESRKWEDKVISERVFRLLKEERAALASVCQLRAFRDNDQMEHSGIALKEDNQFSACLAGMLSSPEKVWRNHITRVQCVVKRMQSQCWGYESAFLPAHIRGISDRMRSRSGQSHESIPAQHHVDQDLGCDSVAGGHLNSAAVPSASDDAQDVTGSEQFLPSPQGDTPVLFSDWTEEYKADPELKELFEYLQKGNVRSGFGLDRK